MHVYRVKRRQCTHTCMCMCSVIEIFGGRCATHAVGVVLRCVSHEKELFSRYVDRVNVHVYVYV